MTAESDCRWLDVCPNYYGRLQVFECAVPKDGAFVGYRTRFDGYTVRHSRLYPDWQLEVERFIRGFRKVPNPGSQWARICVDKDHNDNDRICSFVFFGFQKTTEAEGSGFYIIGYIARALGAKGCHFGDFTLRYALNVCKEDSLKRGIANPLIFALIDHRNKESLALFERNGFVDDSPDEDEPDRYRRFVRFGFGGQEAPRSST